MSIIKLMSPRSLEDFDIYCLRSLHCSGKLKFASLSKANRGFGFMDQQKLWGRIKEGLAETIVGMDLNFLLDLAPKQLEILVIGLSDLMSERGK